MNPSQLAGVPRPVIIVPYNPDWPNRFMEESNRIQNTIGSFITTIEHIGSTSVPGLAAKPIIDMLIGLRSLADTPRFVPLLESMGYRYFPEHEVDLPERRYFSRVPDSDHGFHLHMVEPDSLFFHRHIAFRDYLRIHPEERKAYEQLKVDLANKFGADRDGYTDAKTEFIQAIEQKALGSTE